MTTYVDPDVIAPDEAALPPRPLRIAVQGTPAPQGSKRHVGGGRMVESSKRVKPWREAVKYAALDALSEREVTGDPFNILDGAVSVTATFYFARPKGHYRTGRNAHLLRDSAPPLPCGHPDLDKVLRSTFDALTDAGVWADDKHVAMVTALKAYAGHGILPGAAITITAITSAAA